MRDLRLAMLLVFALAGGPGCSRKEPAAPARPAEATPIDLQLYRPTKAGDRWRTSIVVKRSRSIKGPAPVAAEYLEVLCVATVRVLTTMPNGEPAKLEVLVQAAQIRRAEGAPAQNLALAGVTLIVLRTPSLRITRVDGAALSKEELAALEALWPPGDPAAPTAHDLLGPDGKVAPGARWKPERSLLALRLAAWTRAPSAVLDVDGDVTLKPLGSSGYPLRAEATGRVGPHGQHPGATIEVVLELTVPEDPAALLPFRRRAIKTFANGTVGGHEYEVRARRLRAETRVRMVE